MSEPIDLLTVASNLRHAAWCRIQNALAMQIGPVAANELALARMEFQIAARDLDNIIAIGMDLAA